MDEQDNKRLGELLRRLADGNALVLNEIASLMERLLRVVGNSYYKNHADVEDAIGNLYVKLYDNAHKFKNNSNACAWVIKVYENSIKSHLRSQNKEQLFLQENGADLFLHNEIDEKYIENHLFLREIFDKLTEEERDLIIYYYWCKCSIREVAGILRKPKTSIDRRLKKLEEKIKNLK